MTLTDLHAALDFIRWADQLKAVLRQSSPIASTRRENSAEHTWHACLAALTLAPLLADEIDLERVLAMLVVHDLVEITAGDTYVHDDAARRTQAEREAVAAAQFLQRLPKGPRSVVGAYWDEFAALDTREAKYAKAIDASMAIVLNTANDGDVWRMRATPLKRVHDRIDTFVADFPELADALHRMVDDVDHAPKSGSRHDG